MPRAVKVVLLVNVLGDEGWIRNSKKSSRKLFLYLRSSEHKAQRCIEALFCFLLFLKYFEILSASDCILCLFAHEFVWEVI